MRKCGGFANEQCGDGPEYHAKASSDAETKSSKKHARQVKKHSFVQTLTDKNFKKIVNDKKKHVLVKFYVRRLVRVDSWPSHHVYSVDP